MEYKSILSVAVFILGALVFLVETMSLAGL